MARPSIFLRLLLATCFAVVATSAPSPALAGDCPNGSSICVNAGEAEWTANDVLSGKNRRKDAKKYRKKDPVPLTVKIEGGRGSVFVDGRWVGEAPLQDVALKPGRHDLQVRDGATVLGEGTLKIKKGSGPIELLVSHPDGDS